MIQPSRYGYAKDVYMCNEQERVITKGIASVKYLNKNVSKQLFEVYHQYPTDNFIDTLLVIKQHTKLKNDQLDILIKVDFFKQYGKIPELLRIRDAFDFFKEGNAKQISLNKENPYEFLIPKYATDKNADGKQLKSWQIQDCIGLLHEYESHVKSQNVSDWSYKTKADYQVKYLGYFDLTTNDSKDRRKLYVLDILPLTSKFGATSAWAYKVSVKSIGTGKTTSLTLLENIYKTEPIKSGDIIYASDISKNKKGYWYLNDYFILE